MQQRFKTHIKSHLTFLKDSPIALAVSGGIDSMVLLDLCHSLNLNFSVLHCNFQLRGEDSVEDQKFIEQQCKSYGCDFHTVKFDTIGYVEKNKVSIQMAARDLRYDWFFKQK